MMMVVLVMSGIVMAVTAWCSGIGTGGSVSWSGETLTCSSINGMLDIA